MAENSGLNNAVCRCSWAEKHPLLISYHDREWGIPQHDDVKLFEALLLDGAQAGLSWLTILKKREAYRQAFDRFDPYKVAEYDESKISELLQNKGIIRNRLKIRSAVNNARRTIEMIEKYGSLNNFFWDFVDGKPIVNAYKTDTEVPARTSLSDKVSKELKQHGFTFVGSTIVYAFMQSVGMVNDHLVNCFRYEELVD